jgi:FkbM family methyltransferase
MWSGGDDWVPNQVFWHGWEGYEPETARVFFNLAERAHVTIDVGAHVGYYSLLAAHANPAGRVVALEPVAATFERLRANVVMNDLANVECISVAADEKAGRALIYVPRDSRIPCSAGLSEDFYQPWRDAFVGVEVSTDTLDGIVRSRGLEQVGLVKLDTEGTEPRVLRGGIRLLQEHRPFIVCEVLEAANSARELEALLRPLGYEFSMLTAAGPIPREHVEPDAAHPNYLFTPPRVA